MRNGPMCSSSSMASDVKRISALNLEPAVQRQGPRGPALADIRAWRAEAAAAQSGKGSTAPAAAPAAAAAAPAASVGSQMPLALKNGKCLRLILEGLGARASTEIVEAASPQWLGADGPSYLAMLKPPPGQQQPAGMAPAWGPQGGQPAGGQLDTSGQQHPYAQMQFVPGNMQMQHNGLQGGVPMQGMHPQPNMMMQPMMPQGMGGGQMMMMMMPADFQGQMQGYGMAPQMHPGQIPQLSGNR